MNTLWLILIWNYFTTSQTKQSSGNISISMCPVRAVLRFMSGKTVFSSWAKHLPIRKRLLYAKNVVLVFFSLPAWPGQRSKASLLHPMLFSIIVATISHTETQRRPEENIPQQQRPGRFEHPEETTLTSCQIKPSRWLLGVITVVTALPMSGWAKAPR